MQRVAVLACHPSPHALGRYARDAVDRCRAERSRRWTEVFACARRAWFTRGRVAETAERGPLPEATARLRPDFLGPVVANYCGRWVPSRASARTRWLEPFEHPADGVARLVGSCVDSEASALLGIRRAAGTTYAAPFERCARRAPRLMGNQHWPYVARCVGDAARKAGHGGSRTPCAPAPNPARTQPWPPARPPPTADAMSSPSHFAPVPETRGTARRESPNTFVRREPTQPDAASRTAGQPHRQGRRERLLPPPPCATCSSSSPSSGGRPSRNSSPRPSTTCSPITACPQSRGPIPPPSKRAPPRSRDCPATIKMRSPRQSG